MPLAFKLHFKVSSSADETRWIRSQADWWHWQRLLAALCQKGRKRSTWKTLMQKNRSGETCSKVQDLVGFFFCRLEDELAEEKVWLALHLCGTNLSCRFCSAREDLERSLTSDVSDVGKEPAANGDCSALLRPGAPHRRRRRHPHTSLWQQDGRKTVHYFILTSLAHDGINRNTARLSAVSVAALKCQGRECPPGSAEAFRHSASVQQVQLHHGQSSYTPTCFESSVI